MKNRIYASIFMALFFSSLYLKADSPTPAAAPSGSEIRTDMVLEIDKNTNTVHLISTTNDPNVITKAYVLKHADPYELRPYLLSAVSSERIADKNTFVSCLKYNDGTGVIIVSGEDYKFDKDELKKRSKSNCMTIDEIVKMLDQPNITSSSGQPKFIYFPQYRSAQEIANMANNVGINHRDDHTELQRGSDSFAVDPSLNAVIFYANSYNLKNIAERLLIYDQPLPETKVSVKVVELDYENDAKIGVDFQAWKNGPGSDLFTSMARFGHGMDPAGLVNGTKWGSAKYIQFSPRWNTRFIDFLQAKGKANILVDGTLNIRNNTVGHLENTTVIPNFTDGSPIQNNTAFQYTDIFGAWHPWGIVPTNGTYEDYTLRAYDKNGTAITLSAVALGATVRIGRAVDTGGITMYSLQITDGGGAVFVKNGNNMGTEDKHCYNVEFLQGDAATWIAYTPTWNSSHALVAQKNFQRDTQPGSYGFQMDITPSICKEATTLDIHMINSSLLGFTENARGGHAAPRITTSEVNTTIMVNNNNQRFVIGGLEKSSIVKSVSKVPWLGSIPILGYLLSSESPVAKKTRLVAYVECEHQSPEETVPVDVAKMIIKVNEKTKDTDKGHPYGYDQFLLDKEKKSLDPLP